MTYDVGVGIGVGGDDVTANGGADDAEPALFVNTQLHFENLRVCPRMNIVGEFFF